jgi:hypothetical protein
VTTKLWTNAGENVRVGNLLVQGTIEGATIQTSAPITVTDPTAGTTAQVVASAGTPATAAPKGSLALDGTNGTALVNTDGTAAGWTGVVNTAGYGVFGAGTDGSPTFDGVSAVLGMVPVANVYTLTRALFLDSPTFAAGVVINLAGFPMFVKTKATGPGAGTVIIADVANPGGSPSVFSPGAGRGNSAAATWYAGGYNGGSGGAGNAFGSANQAGSNLTPSGLTPGTGGAGGTPNAGGAGGGGGTNNAPVAGLAPSGSPANLDQAISGRFVSGGSPFSSATGGGGGGGNAAGTNGGGGGAGGGYTMLACRQFVNPSAFVVHADGGAGANASGGPGPAGGGGGGGGGIAILVSVGTRVNVAGGVTLRAAGGAGGNPVNGGGGGVAGGAGVIIYHNLGA